MTETHYEIMFFSGEEIKKNNRLFSDQSNTYIYRFQEDLLCTSRIIASLGPI